MPTDVTTQPVDIARLGEHLDPAAADRLADAARSAARGLDGRVVWNISSTAAGGGVAEMLRPLVAYGRGAGVDVRWVVIDGDPDFFTITKRLHHGLHGRPGSPGDLGADERAHVAAVTATNHSELRAVMRPGDIAICHDPQTAWLVPLLVDDGLRVVWRCHIGTHVDNEWTRRAWQFIAAVEGAHRLVFSRDQYVPDRLRARATVIQPSIDPASAKNRPLDDDQVLGILGHVGVLRAPAPHTTSFRRDDGTPGRVDRVADLVHAGPAATPDQPMVVQVSRWDPLKDMAGVMQSFAEHVDGGLDAHLVLAGPNVSGVVDDPEGAEVLIDCLEQWRSLPHECRSRIQLACLPMADLEENATIVNALQRHVTVVVQKSFEEGFGLTVAEAMWKGTPVVASRVGGIQDQIVDGESGVLVDPDDRTELGRALVELLDDPDRAKTLGEGGRARVRDNFLADRHLSQFAALLGEVADER